MVQLQDTELRQIEQRYGGATRRLLLLDYDGTLVPITARPEDARPSAKVLEILERLSSDSRNAVVVISGRPHEILQEWLGHLPIEFVAEHGVMRRDKSGNWQAAANADETQIVAAMSLLVSLESKYQGMFVEKKRIGAALHYRQAPGFNDESARQWIAEHESELTTHALDAIHGKKVIELLPYGVDKGVAAGYWLGQGDWDFILAAGDDTTDETMFRDLSSGDVSVHVGNNPSTAAAYTLPDQPDFMAMLERLSSS